VRTVRQTSWDTSHIDADASAAPTAKYFPVVSNSRQIQLPVCADKQCNSSKGLSFSFWMPDALNRRSIISIKFHIIY
jgi:hypothetical protein